MTDKAGNILWDQIVEAFESRRSGVAESLWVNSARIAF